MAEEMGLHGGVGLAAPPARYFKHVCRLDSQVWEELLFELWEATTTYS